MEFRELFFTEGFFSTNRHFFEFIKNKNRKGQKSTLKNTVINQFSWNGLKSDIKIFELGVKFMRNYMVTFFSSAVKKSQFFFLHCLKLLLLL